MSHELLSCVQQRRTQSITVSHSPGGVSERAQKYSRSPFIWQQEFSISCRRVVRAAPDAGGEDPSAFVQAHSGRGQMPARVEGEKRHMSGGNGRNAQPGKATGALPDCHSGPMGERTAGVYCPAGAAGAGAPGAGTGAAAGAVAGAAPAGAASTGAAAGASAPGAAASPAGAAP